MPSSQLHDEWVVPGLCWSLCPGCSSANPLRSDYLFILPSVMQAIPSIIRFWDQSSHNLRWQFKENSQIMNISWIFWVIANPLFVQTFKDTEMQVLWSWSGEIWFVTLLLIFLPIEVQTKSGIRIDGDDIYLEIILTHCENIYRLPRWDFSWLGKSKNSFPSRPADSSSKLLLF